MKKASEKEDEEKKGSEEESSEEESDEDEKEGEEATDEKTEKNTSGDDTVDMHRDEGETSEKNKAYTEPDMSDSDTDSSSSSGSSSSSSSSTTSNGKDKEEDGNHKLEEAATEAGRLAELDGVGMETFHSFCRGFHPDLTACEALHSTKQKSNKESQKQNSHFDLRTSFLQKTLQKEKNKEEAKQSKRKAESNTGGLEEDLDRECEAVNLPRSRLRRKTSVACFLPALF